MLLNTIKASALEEYMHRHHSKSMDEIEQLMRIEHSSSGTLFAGQNATASFFALSKPEYAAVGGVPLDCRNNCLDLLLKSVRDNPMTAFRRYLLANAAFRGSGKTVLQAFNMFWFLRETGGFAFEITFNDDQSSLWKGGEVRNLRQFEEAVAVRIIHRLLRKLVDDDWAYSALQESSDHVDDSQLSILESIRKLKNPIGDSLDVVKRYLGVPLDTLTFLGVDEIASAPAKNKIGLPVYSPVLMLRHLTSQYLDKNTWLFLSVTAYGAVDLVKFSTKSARPILLQTLSPIWYETGLNRSLIPLLPAALQPFYNQEMRLNLPYRDMNGFSPLTLYKEVSLWLLETGGHPRRVQALFKQLAGFTYAQDHLDALRVPGNTFLGDDFVLKLKAWLETNNNRSAVRGSVTITVQYPSDLNLLVVKPSPVLKKRVKQLSSVIESLAIDCACSYRMPEDTLSAKKHQYSLVGSGTGFCQFLQKPKVDEILVHTFLPLPVLDLIQAGPYLGPCGSALYFLKESLKSYQTWNSFDLVATDEGINDQNSVSDAGKAFEKVIEASLLLYARANRSFRPSDLCNSDQCGDSFQNVRLEGGEVARIQHWQNVHSFPAKGGTNVITAADIKILVDRLNEENARGAVFSPLYMHNLVSDVYGLFKVDTMEANEYVLLAVQAKDWFGDYVRLRPPKKGSYSVLDSWRKNMDQVFPEKKIIFTNELGETVTVKVLFLLFTANELDESMRQQLNCSDQEGAGSIKTMRNWLPSAAFACETAQKLKELFAWWGKV